MKKRLGDILIDCGLIEEQDLLQALQKQKEEKKRLGEVLIEMGLVTMDDIIWALGDQLNISYIHLNDEIVDIDFASSFSSEFLRQHLFLPIFKVGDRITVVMADPLDYSAQEEIKKELGENVVIALSLPEEIEKYIDELYGKHAKKENSLSFANKGGAFCGEIKNVLKNEVVIEVENFGFLKIAKDRIDFLPRVGKKVNLYIVDET
jgi:type IV pilus assembly protein PilB